MSLFVTILCVKIEMLLLKLLIFHFLHRTALSAKISMVVNPHLSDNISIMNPLHKRFSGNVIEMDFAGCMVNKPTQQKHKLKPEQSAKVKPKQSVKDVDIVYYLGEDTKEQDPVDADPYTWRFPNEFYVAPYQLFNVTLILHIEATSYQGTPLIIKPSPQCYMYYVKPTPLAIITPTKKIRRVPPDTEVTVMGNQSFNRYLIWLPLMTNQMTYAWKCQNSKLCNLIKNKTAPNLVIPKGLVLAGETFDLTLTVTVTYEGHTASDTAKQKIVARGPATLRLICMKNCPPLSKTSNYKTVTYLKVKCHSGCKHIRKEHFIWSINSSAQPGFKFDFDKGTIYGRTGEKLLIKANVLKPNLYNISVSLLPAAKKKGFNSTLLNFTLPQPETCSLRPSSGWSSSTKFTFECGEKTGYYYALYANDDMIINGLPKEVFQRPFVLPQSKTQRFVVRIYDQSRSSVDVPVTATVTGRLDGKPEDGVSSELDRTYQQYRRDCLDNNYAKREFCLINTQVVIEEIRDRELKSAKSIQWWNDFVNTMAKDLLKAPVTEMSDVIHLTIIAAKCLPTNADAEAVAAVTNLCKRIAITFLQMLKRMAPSASALYYITSAEVTKNLGKCGQCMTTQNKDKTQIDVTTPESTVTDLVITEDYPNYEHYDEKIYKSREKLKEAIPNIITTTMVSAKTMALTMVVGEGIVNVTSKGLAVSVVKDTGNILTESMIDADGVNVSMSQDFRGDKHAYDILISAWFEDITSWNAAHTRIATAIVNIQVWHSNCVKRVSNFTKPFGIYFKKMKGYHFKETIVDADVVVPKNMTKLMREQLNPVIKVIRVSVANKTMLVVKFYDVPKSGRFDVVITKFKYPTYEDFLNKQDPRQNNAVEANFINAESFNIWCYVGIMTSASVKFRASFAMATCVRWISKSGLWTPTCQVSAYSSNDTVMLCECTSLTMISGYLQNLDAVFQQIEPFTFVLELKVFWIVFLTVAAVLLLYSLFILLFLLKKQTNYYYLPDNSLPDRFAYLLLVRTSSSLNSGTTSQIAVSISGAKAKSRPHVLNYPDPQLRLLQTGTEDVFIVTTRRHLGNIKHMKIWFNSEGYSPSWYCKDIFLYDMQTQSYWVFDVATQFSLDSNGKSYVVLKPLKPEEFLARHKWYQRIRFCDDHHTCMCSRSKLHFDLLKRSTVILSKVLMICVLVLWLMNLLSLDLNMSIDSYTEYRIGFSEVIKAVIGAVVAFLIHVTISWIFRSSNIQYSQEQEEVPIKFCGTVLCWILLAVLITTNLTILMIFCFWVPTVSALVWLTICGIAILLDVVVLENVLVAMRSSFVPVRKRIYFEKIYWDIVHVVETQRSLLYRHFGNLKMARPHLQKAYFPLDSYQMKVKEQLTKLRTRIASQFIDLFMFLIYVVILYVVVLMNKSGATARCKAELYYMMNGELTRTQPFVTIKNTKGVYHYLNETLVPVLMSRHWYGDFVQLNPGILVDFSNKIIGIARIRQNRIQKEGCTVPFQMKFIHVKCNPEADQGVLDQQKYSYGWGNYTNKYEKDRFYGIWSYSHENSTHALPVQGEFALYSGGGYMAYLGRTLYNTYVNLKIMVERYWINEETRNIFIEFLSYNVNDNLFNSVRLLYEQSATGYVSNQIRIDSARMIFVSDEIEQQIIIFSCSFVAWVMILLIRQSVGLVKKIRTFYKDTWFMIDIIIVMISIACIALMIIRIGHVQIYLSKIEKAKHNEFVPYFTMFFLEHLLSAFAAILICIATVRLWKFLRFALMFRIFEKTISLSTNELLGTTLMYLLVVAAFSFSGYMLYGCNEKQFYSTSDVLRTIITMAFLPSKLNMAAYSNYDSTYVFFPLHVFFNKVMVSIVIVILIMNYKRAELELKSSAGSYNVQTYVREQSQHIPRVVRARAIRLRGGYEGTQKKNKPFIQTKQHEYRYSAAWIPDHKLSTMRILTKCLLRHKRTPRRAGKLTNSDVSLMLEACRNLLQKKELNYSFFYKAHFQNTKMTLVDERRFDLMSKLTEAMLSEERSYKQKQQRRFKGLPMAIPLRFLRKSQKIMRKCAMALSLINYRLYQVEI